MSCVWYYCSGLEISITECTSWKRVNLLHPGLPLHLFHLGTSHCLSPEGEGGGGGEGMLYSYKAPFPCTILTPSIHPEKSSLPSPLFVYPVSSYLLWTFPSNGQQFPVYFQADHHFWAILETLAEWFPNKSQEILCRSSTLGPYFSSHLEIREWKHHK